MFGMIAVLSNPSDPEDIAWICWSPKSSNGQAGPAVAPKVHRDPGDVEGFDAETKGGIGKSRGGSHMGA